MADNTQPPVRTGWPGWIYFAGLLLMLSGIFHVITGLVALFKDEIYLIGPRTLLVLDTYAGWGTVHLAIGVVLVFASLGLFKGSAFWRVVGVILTALSAITSFAFLGAYPLWAILIIAIDIFILYAIIVHGAEAARAHASSELYKKGRPVHHQKEREPKGGH